MKKLLIFGTTEMARIAFFFFSSQREYEVVGFTVDSSHRDSDEHCGLAVYDFDYLEKTHPPSEYELFIAVGPTKMNTLREEKFYQAKSRGYALASFISEKATCYSRVGENCFVADFANVQPFATVCDNTFIWEFALVGNEASVGPNCFLSPKSVVSTFARIGKNSVLGTSSTVRTRVVVGEYSLIGATCYISANTLPNSVYGARQSENLGNVSMKLDISN